MHMVTNRTRYMWNPAMEDRPGLIRRILWAIDRIIPHFRRDPMGYGRIIPGYSINGRWWATYPEDKKSAADAVTSAAQMQGTNDRMIIPQERRLVK